MTKHLTPHELEGVMQAAFSCLPGTMRSGDLSTFIHGLLEGYSVRGSERIMLLMQLVQATDGIQSIDTGDGVLMVGGNSDEEEQPTKH